MREAQYLYKLDRKSHAQKIQNKFLLLGVKMQKISKAEPAREPRQKLATLAFILEVSQYLYSRSVSGAGNLQLGTRISIAHIGNSKLQLKTWGHLLLLFFTSCLPYWMATCTSGQVSCGLTGFNVFNHTWNIIRFFCKC